MNKNFVEGVRALGRRTISSKRDLFNAGSLKFFPGKLIVYCEDDFNEFKEYNPEDSVLENFELLLGDIKRLDCGEERAASETSTVRVPLGE